MVRKKVKDTGLKLQCGIQGLSDDSYETAARYIDEGAIGKPVMAQIDYSRNEKVDLWNRPPDPDVQPGVNLDWETFLGSAPKRDWEPDRFFSWRRYWDYSGGIATDLFVHRVARIIRACKLTTPSRAVAVGGKHFFTESKAEVPDTFNVMLEYPEGMTVMLVSTLANETRIKHMIRGRKGTLEFTREGFEITPERLFKDEVKPATHSKSGGEDMALHHHNLHNAIRHGADLKCDADIGFYASMACQMAVESFRRQKYLAWDAQAEKVVEA
ncbi:MAG: Gfo/Idh/MocA family oxidoreductase [Bryobacterales bacterium]